MAYSNNIREEEIKNRLRKDYFAQYDAEQVLGDIDFAVAVPTHGPELFETEYLLWAEAKKGTSHDIYESLVQLILTIGKARTFDHVLPPAFLGAFDAGKIAFIPYNAILDIFYQNDFNWNVTPSDHSTREFRQVMQKVRKTLEQGMLIFSFDKDDRELKRFIKANFKLGKSSVSKVRINKNNFTAIYQKWLAEVKPSIAVNWETAKKRGIIDADFYLADILSEHNVTLRPKLYVLLRTNYYELDRKIDETGLWDSKKAEFNDRQVAHTQFWNRYERPPKREYWDYIVERRDLLVPQDVRERKGSFFTPHKWVELSQQYLAAELGENWQDEYYIWDCCGGTGNLEAGLTNKYHIWVSTLDKADVDVMHDRIRHMNEASTNGQGANLLDSHVFQFDFLNDPFKLDDTDESKLPKSLIEVLKDDDKRHHLVIYINPPYAEAGDAKQRSGTGKNKSGVAFNNYVYNKYKREMGLACRELFAQFFTRVYDEIPSSVLAEFSTLKILQAPNFRDFRNHFRAKLGRNFIVPANTFDNVKGQFPIGFFIWHTEENKHPFEETETDVYAADATLLGKKRISSYVNQTNVIVWLRQFYDKKSEPIGYLRMNGTNVQNNLGIYFTSKLSDNDIHNHFYAEITKHNVMPMCVYLAIRQVIEPTWMNDREQYLVPSEEWETDLEFQSDCIVFALFDGQNRIQSKDGINHWIPFTESEVNAQESFQSHFMSDFLRGKSAGVVAVPRAGHKETLLPFEKEVGTSLDGRHEARPLHWDGEPSLFAAEPLAAAKQYPSENYVPLEHLSAEAKAVMEAGRKLWHYYHKQPNANPNASLYDIRLHFQGYKTTKSGKVQMNTESTDARYTELLTTLRTAIKTLAARIAPKVYSHGFLLK